MAEEAIPASENKRDNPISVYYQDSLILRIIYGKFCRWARNDLLGSALFVLLLFTPILVSGFVEGTFFITGEGKGIMEDYAALCVITTFFLLLWAAKKSLDSFHNVFNGETGIKKSLNWNNNTITQKKYNDIVGQSADYIQHKRFLSNNWKFLFFLNYTFWVFFGILITFTAFTNPISPDVWGNKNHSLGFISECFFFLFFFGVVVPELCWRFIGIIMETRRILTEIGNIKGAFIILPIARDNAGGLKPLGNLSLTMTAIPFSAMIGYGIFVFLTSINWLYFFIINGMVIIFFFVVFFYPLGTMSSLMKKAKEVEIERLTKELARHYLELHNKLEEKDGIFDDESNRISDRIQSLTILHDTSTKMATWPFDLETLGKFIGLVVAPLLFILIEHIIYR